MLSFLTFYKTFWTFIYGYPNGKTGSKWGRYYSHCASNEVKDLRSNNICPSPCGKFIKKNLGLLPSLVLIASLLYCVFYKMLWVSSHSVKEHGTSSHNTVLCPIFDDRQTIFVFQNEITYCFSPYLYKHYFSRIKFGTPIAKYIAQLDEI